MSHPYVPQGTPITVTTEGWWDGDHNGNQPVMAVANSDGETKKYHIPHGARVDTHPEKSWPESFTIDKTPVKDTPRKPEPQIGDTVAVALDEENGSTVVGILSATYADKFWIEGDDFYLQVPHQGSRITVIEPARPAVPEEPEPCVLINERNDILRGEANGFGTDWIDEDDVVMSWAEAWKNGPWYRIERGPVVGG